MHLEGTIQPTRYQVFVMRNGLCELLTSLMVFVVSIDEVRNYSVDNVTAFCLLPR